MARIQLTDGEERLRRFLLKVAKYAGTREGYRQPQLRFAGGWVRDKMLGMDSPDIDIAVDSMTGLKFAQLMKDFVAASDEAQDFDSEAISRISEIPARPDQSKHLETATLKVGGLDVDIVNLRKETYTDVSRNPQMEFGTPEEDALRRDATVNALFYNLHSQEIEDLTGQGLSDLELRVIRTPLAPHQTFKDDPLRVLRCIRFASRFGYNIVEEAEASMKDLTIREALRSKITRERIGTEVEKMLKGPHPNTAMAYVDRLGLYDTIFTDPAQQETVMPDTKGWYRVYSLLPAILQREGSQKLSALATTLVVRECEVYWAWLLCALTPWAPLVTRSQYTPRKGQPKTFAALVAREGLKVDNKAKEVIDQAMSRLPEVISIKDRAAETQVGESSTKRKRDPLTREELGMLLYQWGASWRSSIFLAVFVELVQAKADSDSGRVLEDYEQLVSLIQQMNLLEAHKLKPLVDGKQLMVEMGRGPGPWMTKAVKALLRWQFRNPNIEDPSKGIEEVALQFRGDREGKVA